MRWSDLGRSRNLEDRRGGGGGGGMGRMGLGTVVVVFIVALITRQNPLALLQQVGGGDAGLEAPAVPIEDPASEREVRFVSFVLDTAQATWGRIFPGLGASWRDAKLVLFRDQTVSACGGASAASGPFYCPGDEKVYIDLSFYDELATSFGAPGEFAQAYVLAHEIGHHVQRLLGVEEQMRAAQQRQPGQANTLSVKLELQADCFAGVWGNAASKEGIIQAGDLEAGLAAAAAVGDDRLQRMGSGTVTPETWTHGSSQQRVTWFRRGFDSGSPNSCDTFK